MQMESISVPRMIPFEKLSFQSGFAVNSYPIIEYLTFFTINEFTSKLCQLVPLDLYQEGKESDSKENIYSVINFVYNKKKLNLFSFFFFENYPNLCSF